MLPRSLSLPTCLSISVDGANAAPGHVPSARYLAFLSDIYARYWIVLWANNCQKREQKEVLRVLSELDPFQLADVAVSACEAIRPAARVIKDSDMI